jgi:hypothetical protein
MLVTAPQALHAYAKALRANALAVSVSGTIREAARSGRQAASCIMGDPTISQWNL